VISSGKITIAAAAYPLSWLESWEVYMAKAETWVAKAVNKGAHLAVFPEYGGMELASLDGEKVSTDPHVSIDAISARYDNFTSLWSDLAVQYGLVICAPSLPFREPGQSRVVNRTGLFLPNGQHDFQDKLIMTRFEREEWGISGGPAVKIFETPIATLGIPICYDCEFPLVARAMVNAGAEILLVPSVTETIRGYHRVRIGAMARALENQCLSVQAPLVGEAHWSPATDISIGAAGIYGPPDIGFPEDGVIAIGALNQVGWVYGDITLEQIRTVRANGTVLNHRHWKDQDGRLAQPIRIDMTTRSH
jgi:predicted amidohydrolase